ncbi:MAG: hypothetical protein ACI4P3_04965 [Candidatus Spyradosoma sp.]
MASRNEVKIAKLDSNGKEAALAVKSDNFDAPLLPVEEMERLSKFFPEANRLIIEQTQIESKWRRAEISENNARKFRERRLGQIFAFLIGFSGIIGGSCVAVFGSSVAGGTIATASIATLAVAFLRQTEK